MKKLVLWIFVILWMIIIFLFSNMNGLSSNRKSKKIINIAIEKSINIISSSSVINGKKSKSKISTLVQNLNIPLRKCAHGMVYFILSIFLLVALSQSISNKEIIILYTCIISFIYAYIDEFHQLYVSGRTGQFSDVVIDMFGVIMACVIFSMLCRL